jgi:hypothetical protein
MHMPIEEPSSAKPQGPGEPRADRAGQVECPKCGATVVLPANTCPACHKHLYLLCPECDQPNFRANVLCDYCGATLRLGGRSGAPPIHRHVWPLNWHVDRQRRWLLPTQVALFISCVALTTLVVIKIVEYRRPNQPPEAPAVYVLENGKLRPLEEVLKSK